MLIVAGQNKNNKMLNKPVKEVYLRPFVPKNCPVCNAEFLKGNRVPGQRLVIQEYVTYTCGCEVEANEYQPNRFNLFVRNCGKNEKCIPVENLKKSEVRFELIKEDSSTGLFDSTFIFCCGEHEFKERDYFILDRFQLGLNVTEQNLTGITKPLLFLFTTEQKANNYCKNEKIIYPKRFDYLCPRRVSKQEVISQFKRYHSHALIDVFNTPTCGFHLTSKSKIVKLV